MARSFHLTDRPASRCRARASGSPYGLGGAEARPRRGVNCSANAHGTPAPGGGAGGPRGRGAGDRHGCPWRSAATPPAHSPQVQAVEDLAEARVVIRTGSRWVDRPFLSHGSVTVRRAPPAAAPAASAAWSRASVTPRWKPTIASRPRRTKVGTPSDWRPSRSASALNRSRAAASCRISTHATIPRPRGGRDPGVRAQEMGRPPEGEAPHEPVASARATAAAC
jgi:hypothetical protein